MLPKASIELAPTRIGIADFSGLSLGVGVGEASGVGTGGSDVDFLARLPDCAITDKAQSKSKPTRVTVPAEPAWEGNACFMSCETLLITVAVAPVYLLD